MLICILLLWLAYFTQANIVLGPSATMNAGNLQHRSDYMQSLNQQVSAGYDSVGHFVTTIKQPIPTSNVLSLTAVLYAIKSDGTKTSPPNFTSRTDATYIYLLTTYSSSTLTNQYGCHELPTSPNYMGIVCDFSLDYIATESGQVLSTIDFTMSVKIPKQASATYSITATKTYKTLCDCQIVTSYPLMITPYSNLACTTRFVGNTIVYGSLLCLKVTSTSSLVNQYTFNPTSLLMTTINALGAITSAEIIPLALVNKGPGWATLAFDVLTVGSTVYFTTTVMLGSTNSPLILSTAESGSGVQGIQGSSPQYYVAADAKSAAANGNNCNIGLISSNAQAQVTSSGSLIGSLLGVCVALAAIL